MFELNYTAPHGGVLRLADNADFILTGVDGLTEATVNISSSEIAAKDGDVINSTRTEPRGMVLYFTMRQGRNVEEAKRNILSVIKPKQTGTLYWKQNGRALEIAGTVEEISMPRFNDNVVMQITLYCSKPYWSDAEYIIKQIELVIKMHRFVLAFPQGSGTVFGRYNLDLTRSFENTGDVAVGLNITIIATGDVKNPLLERSDGLYFGLTETMVAGDVIEITTTRGQKTVKKNGENIIAKVIPGSTWLQLEVGDNTFTISDESGNMNNMYFSFKYKQEYV